MKQSPLKDKPLRNPGQSLSEQREEQLFDKLFAPFFIALLLCALATWEWWRFLYPRPSQPWFFTIAAGLGTAYAVWKIRREIPKFRALRMAIEGEKAVGQYLERLRESGYQVFHDIVGSNFNVDHIIIGPAGVFTIETKTYSKPMRGEARVVFDGEQVLINGFAPDRDPVIQAKAQASWVKEFLSESTGRKFAVRPVIVFPGWFIEQGAGTTRQVWVLNPKALPDFLANEPLVLPPEDVKLAAFHLSRFIRNHERSS